MSTSVAMFLLNGGLNPVSAPAPGELGNPPGWAALGPG